MLNKYELMVILDPRKTEEKLNSLFSFIEATVSSSDASEISKEVVGIRKLAYPIQKQDQGYYVIFKFISSGLKNKDIENKLNINEDVFRYMIIRDESEKIFNRIKAKEDARMARRESRASDIEENRQRDVIGSRVVNPKPEVEVGSEGKVSETPVKRNSKKEKEEEK